MFKRALTSTVGLVLLCYLIALAPRLWLISERSIQPDEHHWVKRSSVLMEHLTRAEYSTATSHLDQPGIVPSLVMGVGQLVSARYNAERGFELGQAGFLDKLTASRISVALFASLIAPLLFLAGRGIVGLTPSLLAAVLLALDPHHIALSRIAHLDSILSLLVTATFFLFYYAELKQSVFLKCLTGVFWGLCLATKPTSVVLVIAMVGFKFFVSLGLWKDKPRSWRFVSWSDFFAVFIAHVFLCSIYTKFWETNSSYVWRLKINSPLASWLYETGLFLQGVPLFSLLVLVVLGLSSITGLGLLINKTSAGWGRHIASVIFLVSFLLYFWQRFPAIFENQTLYWIWALGLSSYAHEAYGLQWDPPPFGYVGIAFRQIPTVILLGSLISLIGIWRGSRSENALDQQQSRFLVACLAVVAFWALVLGVSSKQGIRYFLPAMPELYLLAGFGLFISVDGFTRLIKAGKKVSHVILISLCFVSGGMLVRWVPYYELYFTDISGGIVRAYQSEEALPAVGQRSSLEFLRERAIAEKRKFEVMVLGDAESLKQSYKLAFPGEKMPFNLRAFGALGNGDFVLVFPAFRKVFREWQEAHLDTKLENVFNFNWRGLALMQLYHIPYMDYLEPEKMAIRKSPKRTGTHEQFGEGGAWVAIGRAGKDQKEVLFHGQYARVNKGRYRFSVPIGRPDEVVVSSETHSAETAVVKLEMSSGCYRVVRYGELELGRLKDFALDCSFENPIKAHLKVYWWGKVSVAVGSPSVRSLVEVTEDGV